MSVGGLRLYWVGSRHLTWIWSGSGKSNEANLSRNALLCVLYRFVLDSYYIVT